MNPFPEGVDSIVRFLSLRLPRSLEPAHDFASLFLRFLSKGLRAFSAFPLNQIETHLAVLFFTYYRFTLARVSVPQLVLYRRKLLRRFFRV